MVRTDFFKKTESGDHGLGRRIKAARRKRGFSQQDLANYIGVTQGRIAQWESAGVRPPVARIEQLSAALGVIASELTWGGEKWDTSMLSIVPVVAPGDFTELPRIEKPAPEPRQRKMPPRPKPKCRVCGSDHMALFGICSACIMAVE